jgi:hypothetical protein
MSRLAPWFLPKRFGYGTGWPVAWQGWALLGGHVGLLAVGAHFLAAHPWALAAYAALITTAALPLYARRTAGGWRWRWG